MTDRFDVSSYFTSDIELIKEAVKKSNLPEGISVVGKNEAHAAKKPFIVLAYAGYSDEVVEAIKAGALDYVEIVTDVDKLARKLSH